MPASQNQVKTKNTHSQRLEAFFPSSPSDPRRRTQRCLLPECLGQSSTIPPLAMRRESLKRIPRTSHDLEFSRRQQLQQNPCTCRPLGQPTSCIGTHRRKLPPQGPSLRQTGQPRMDHFAQLNACNLMKVSDPLYSLSIAETHTRGTFHGLHGVDNQMMRDIIRGRCHIRGPRL